MADDRQTEAAVIDKPPKDFFRLLLVDDEPSARNLLRALLKEQGYSRINEANDGAEALDLLKKERCDLVLLDKNMPGKDGLQVLAEGKKLQPKCEFIMITAYGSMETAIQSMDLGAFSYVTKPFADFEVILSRIDQALALVGTRRENELLNERMRLLLSELEKAEARLAELGSEEAPAPVDMGDRAVVVLEAVHRLRKLSIQLDALGEKAQGKAADLFAKVGKTVSDVADLLDN